MTKIPQQALLAAALCGAALLLPAWAKLPAPNDEAKAKAAEAAAKTAWAGKVDGYRLCLAMDKTAADYHGQAKKAGKDLKPPVATPPCADPGPFVYVPPAPASGAAPAAAASAPAAAPAVAAAPAKK